MSRIMLLIAGLLIGTVTLQAQMVFFFLPELYGRSVDGLGSFRIQNLSPQAVPGRVFITVKEIRAKSAVVNVVTPVTTVAQGVTDFPKVLYNRSTFQFANNSLGAIANQTRALAPGNYEFCFRFVPEDKGLDEAENCFEAEIQPLVPLTLLNPVHQDTICNKRPVLSWQPPMPYSGDMRFRLMLTEKTTAEPVESMLTNRPLLLLDNISGVSVNYPAAYPELKEGKTYCWQVVAYIKNVIISKSEIWEFTVQCNEKAPPVPFNGYRELKLLQNGNYYFANHYIQFAFTNNYNVKDLRYEVYDMAAPDKKLKNLPDIILQPGLNKIDLNLSESGLTPDNHYILKVYPFNEPAIEVRFVYQEQAEQ